jgi:acyl-coenzyme A synthetase/AMP-(fatty) acid ligase
LPRAYVVLKTDITAKILEEFVAQKVAKHKRLTGGIKFIQEVPKLASGKIVRKVIREWTKTDAEEVEQIVKSKL